MMTMVMEGCPIVAASSSVSLFFCSFFVPVFFSFSAVRGFFFPLFFASALLFIEPESLP